MTGALIEIKYKLLSLRPIVVHSCMNGRKSGVVECLFRAPVDCVDQSIGDSVRTDKPRTQTKRKHSLVIKCTLQLARWSC